MTLQIQESGEQILAMLSGRLDATTVNQFQDDVKPLMETSVPKIIIDCSELEYISSQGLRMFLILQKTVNAKGSNLVLTNMTAAVKEVFDITGFSSIIKID